MIMLWTKKETDIKFFVSGVHYQPFDNANGLGKTKETLEAEGCIFVEKLLEPTINNNSIFKLYINPLTKEQWYEYSDIPKTEIELLKQQIDGLNIAMANMIGV